MFNSLNHHNKFNQNNNKNLSKNLLNKGYFSNLNKKIIYSLYMMIKTEFNKKLGKKCKVSLLEHVSKSYSGLKEYKVDIPIKRNELKYKENKELVKGENKKLSSKRIKIEHVFAYIKSYRIMQRLNYYSKDKIEILFNSIANIYNLYQFIKI